MNAIAGNNIAIFGVARIGVLQYLGAIQIFPTVALAHLNKAGVVFVDLGLGQALVRMLLAERRDRVDDDIDPRVGFDDREDPLLIVFDKFFGTIARREVVGTEGQDNPLRLHYCNGLRHCHIT